MSSWHAVKYMSILASLYLPCMALNPGKRLTQYSRTTWSQEQGLPQDTIQAITQTSDGYLWLGTAEGLARFDGYDFTVFDKEHDRLPSNSITALAATSDHSLWIGTPNGLTQMRDGRFRTFTTKDGLPDNAIAALHRDHSDNLWIAAGLYLTRFEGGQFTTYVPGRDIPVTSVRAVSEDAAGNIWVGGFGGVAELVNGRFVSVITARQLGDNVASRIAADNQNNIWVAGPHGLLVRSSRGGIKWYDTKDGLPDAVVRTVTVDRDGNIWAGTNRGVARFDHGRFSAFPATEARLHDVVLSVFEDREADLWLGTNSGLTRLRDDIFTVYGTSEGLPSDLPNAVFQDSLGKIWIGFHDSGLMQFAPGKSRIYTTRDGLPSDEVLSIRQAPGGDLLIGTRNGAARMHGSSLITYSPPDPLARRTVYDAMEDARGTLWLASAAGLLELRGREYHWVVAASPLLSSGFGVLCRTHDGTMWAGTLGRGLWRIHDGDKHQFTVADGLSSNAIRSLEEDSDGTLWIGTFGGGLNAFRDGKFERFTAKQGLLSDNVYHIMNHGDSLWLATSRGICRVNKARLRDLTARKIARLTPSNYGTEDGLRSAQCAPNNFVAGGGAETSDGRLWFPTSRALALLEPEAHTRRAFAPAVHILEITADGRALDLSRPARLSPGTGRIQVRYTAIHLRAPEIVQYSYQLKGADSDWAPGGGRRLINYNNLRHGSYQFVVRAELPGGLASEQSYSFVILRQPYETTWFLVLCAIAALASIGLAHKMRLRHVRNRFRLVLEERVRLAREIHDTLAQGFVGISSQLDAVAMCMPEDASTAARHLNTAREMARHSITEARRSVMDLRTSVLDKQGLAAALESGARLWADGSGVDLTLNLAPLPSELPREVEQQLLRITQEAVANAVKHASATKISVQLRAERKTLYLRICDNGCGFCQDSAVSPHDGHFGLAGMKERAQRISGELLVKSSPGNGTEVELTLPIS